MADNQDTNVTADAIEDQILRFLSHRDYYPVKARDLAKALDMADDASYGKFREAFNNLKKQGRVVFGSKSTVNLPSPGGRIVGIFRGNPKGFGFVEPLESNAHLDLFIPPHATKGAMSGDKVVVKTSKRGMRGGKMSYGGEVVEILERGHSHFVGTLCREDNLWLVRPDGTTIVEPVIVEDVSAKSAKEADKVVVEILQYSSRPGQYGRGVITEVLGKSGKYSTEIKAVIEQFSIPTDFPEEVLDEGRGAASGFEAAGVDGRDDISDKTIITIDPETAKDFDDAISLERTGSGQWILGVHIADVSSFVGLGSEMDLEARERGNSVYLPGRTIPMLPEVLSNGVCSLQPGQRRFAKSVYITYDADGNIQGREYANSVICSTARLTYLQANDILEGKGGDFSSEVVELLRNMEKLARAIEGRRRKAGMLHLDLPETEVIMNDDGDVVDAEPADQSYPHTIIEMFMVEANEAVAALLDRFQVPFMRRIHPEPDTISMKNLGRFLRVCGMNVPKDMDREAMQSLLESVRGTPAEFAVNLHILRSLQKAEYSPLQIGHFALASTYYCHFTSPIRRYADLMIHRLLNAYLRGELNKIGLEEVLPEGELKEIGAHISMTEQRADRAEKELKLVLILNMLSKRIGEEFEGAVAGMSNYGVYVHIYKFGVEGFVEYKDLGPDEWDYDDRTGVVTGKFSGVRVEMGMGMKVRLVDVNIAARQMNVSPVEALGASKGKSGPKKTTKKRKFKNKRKKQGKKGRK